jgi:hypothetical protein
VDALVQFSPDFRLCLAVPHSPLLPPREPKLAHIGAISISSASSPQCRLISFVAFPLTVSDVLHARLYCSLGGSTCSRRIATPLASRATSLPIVALHAVQLLLRFQLPNPCSPGLAASLPRSHTRVRATWAYSCPSQATRARAPTAPPAPSAHAPLNTCTRYRLPLRYRAYARATRSAPLAFAPALPAVPLTSSRPLPARHAPSLTHAHALAPVHLHASRARSALLLLCTPEPHHLLPLAPRLLPSRAPTSACRHPAHARLVPRMSHHATTAAAPRSAPRRSVRAAPALPTTLRLRSASHAPPAPAVRLHRTSPLCALRIHLPRSPRRLPSRAPAPGNRPAACLVEKRKEGRGTPMEKREGKMRLDSAAGWGKRRRYLKGLCAITENYRDLFVKQNFPLI